MSSLKTKTSCYWLLDLSWHSGPSRMNEYLCWGNSSYLSAHNMPLFSYCKHRVTPNYSHTSHLTPQGTAHTQVCSLFFWPSPAILVLCLERYPRGISRQSSPSHRFSYTLFPLLESPWWQKPSLTWNDSLNNKRVFCEPSTSTSFLLRVLLKSLLGSSM